jgi:carbon starvation protein
MSQIVFNDRVDAALSAFFVAVVVAMLVAGIRSALRALAIPRATVQEVGVAAAA